MFRIVLLLAIAALFLFGHGRQARAETYHTCKGFIDSLPATISTQGTWCLRKDLTTAMTSGNAIEIATSNVTIDCNGFKIGGLAAGAGTLARGISAGPPLNVTVRNCNIRGFSHGISLGGQGGGHLVENNSLDSNTRTGMLVDGVGSIVRNNAVIDTGGSSTSSGSAIGIDSGFGSVSIINNTVNGVAPGGTNATAYGINSPANGEGSISGNRIGGLAPTGTGIPFGIFSSSSGGIIVRDNNVRGPGSGVAGGIGIRCGGNAETARGNAVVGFATGISLCLTSLNVVNTNL